MRKVRWRSLVIQLLAGRRLHQGGKLATPDMAGGGISVHLRHLNVHENDVGPAEGGVGVFIGRDGVSDELEGFDAVVDRGDREAEFLNEADCDLLVDVIYIQSALNSVVWRNSVLTVFNNENMLLHPLLRTNALIVRIQRNH